MFTFTHLCKLYQEREKLNFSNFDIIISFLFFNVNPIMLVHTKSGQSYTYKIHYFIFRNVLNIKNFYI